MRAIQRTVYGDVDVLTMNPDAPVPVPKAGQVLVRVTAAGLDQGVWHIMTGTPLLARLAFGLRRPRAAGLGADLAGIVEAVGPGVTEFAKGDEVLGAGEASFAEFAIAKATHLVRKPAALSFEEAAVLAISGVTAVQALADRVSTGTRVLVLGAAGGVGSFATQLAVAAGGIATGAARAPKLDFVRSLGATAVDYAAGPIAGEFDLVIDTGGNRTLSQLRSLLAPKGTAVIVGGEGAGGRLLAGFDRSLRASALSPFASHTLVGFTSIIDRPSLESLVAAVADGRVRPPLDRVVPLERTAEAIRSLRAGEVRGKLAIAVA